MKLIIAFHHFSKAPRLKRMPYMQSTFVGLPVTYGVNQLPGLCLHEQTRKKQEADGDAFLQRYLPSLQLTFKAFLNIP
jgi:hypothetical protein